MPTIKITTKGIDRAHAQLDEMVALARQAAPTMIDIVTRQVMRQEKTLLSLGTHKRGTVTGSVSPEPPWRISGKLRDSVKIERARKTGTDRWSGRVGPSDDTPYGRIQELGGWTGRNHATYLPKRPSLKPAWEIVRPTVTRRFASGWQKSTDFALH